MRLRLFLAIHHGTILGLFLGTLGASSSPPNAPDGSGWGRESHTIQFPVNDFRHPGLPNQELSSNSGSQAANTLSCHQSMITKPTQFSKAEKRQAEIGRSSGGATK